MYEFYRNYKLFFNCLILCSFISCGTSEPELPKKPLPEIPTPPPGKDLPPGKKPEPTPEPPRSEPIESCVNGMTYGIEIRYYPYIGTYYVPKCNGLKPLVVGNNGTNTVARYYMKTIRHLASKGFMVIWPERRNTGSGESCIQALEFGFTQKDVYPGIYAITGHSQGGSAVLTCGGLAEQKWPNYRAALLPNEPACGMRSKEIEKLAGLIDQKVLFFSGALDTSVPERWVGQCYNYVKSDKAWIIGRWANHLNTGYYIPELSLAFFKAALLDQDEGWNMLKSLDSRKYRWKSTFKGGI